MSYTPYLAFFILLFGITAFIKIIYSIFSFRCCVASQKSATLSRFWRSKATTKTKIATIRNGENIYLKIAVESLMSAFIQIIYGG